MDKKPQIRSIQFDLDKDKLREHGFNVDVEYTVPEKLEAHRLLGKCLNELGFKQEQKSVYHSREPMTIVDVVRAVRKAENELPWLANCTKKLGSHIVTAQFDLMPTLLEAAEVRRSQETSTPEVEKAVEPQEMSVNFDEIDIELDDEKLSSNEHELDDYEHDVI
jgi:virulence-associated protein VapD